MYDLMRERGYYGGFMLDAISACDVALWDLRGQILDQPVYQLLGGAYQRSIPCYVSGLPRPTDDERVELALEFVDRGFDAFKLAAGKGAREDTASMMALRRALGDDATLLLDAHWVYTLDEAVRLGHALTELGAGFFEAPINPEDVESHAQLAAGCRCAYRSWRDRADALPIPPLADAESSRYPAAGCGGGLASRKSSRSARWLKPSM